MTAADRRYALYFVPPADEPLARLAANWLGGPCDAIAEPLRREVTAAPARYGFHATLKAPFRLHEEAGPADLIEAAERLASAWRGFTLPPLRLHRINRFLALVPTRYSAALHAFANACVLELDRFRAPLDGDEIARRRKAGLSSRQDAYMLGLGYPYVLDEFRFHMTLTGQLDDTREAEIRPVLETLLEPLLSTPLSVRDLAILGEPADGGAFRLVRRLPLLPP